MLFLLFQIGNDRYALEATRNPRAFAAAMTRLASSWGLHKCLMVTAGGATRQQSVANGACFGWLLFVTPTAGAPVVLPAP